VPLSLGHQTWCGRNWGGRRQQDCFVGVMWHSGHRCCPGYTYFPSKFEPPRFKTSLSCSSSSGWDQPWSSWSFHTAGRLQRLQSCRVLGVMSPKSWLLAAALHGSWLLLRGPRQTDWRNQPTKDKFQTKVAPFLQVLCCTYTFSTQRGLPLACRSLI